MDEPNEKMRIAVKGSGDESYVVTSIPDEGVFTKGPMPEAEALALAQELASELRGARTFRARYQWVYWVFWLALAAGVVYWMVLR